MATILTDGQLIEIAVGPELVIHQADERARRDGRLEQEAPRRRPGSSSGSRRRPSPTPTPRRRRSRSSTRTSPRRSARCSPATRSTRIAGSSAATCPRSRSACTTGWSTSRRSRSSRAAGIPQVIAKQPPKTRDPPRARRHPRVDRRAALLSAHVFAQPSSSPRVRARGVGARLATTFRERHEGHARDDHGGRQGLAPRPADGPPLASPACRSPAATGSSTSSCRTSSTPATAGSTCSRSTCRRA